SEKLESNLSQLRPENRVKRGSMTQSQAKRINEIVFPWLFRDQGVGGSNPLSPTILSLALSIVYAATAASQFSVHFGTLGTAEGNPKPKPHCSAHFLRNATSSLILS